MTDAAVAERPNPQEVWDEMREALTHSGWRNYSLFLQPGTGMVVGYFEADDVDAARRAIAASPVNTRWQAEMARWPMRAETAR